MLRTEVTKALGERLEPEQRKLIISKTNNDADKTELHDHKVKGLELLIERIGATHLNTVGMGNLRRLTYLLQHLFLYLKLYC